MSNRLNPITGRGVEHRPAAPVLSFEDAGFSYSGRGAANASALSHVTFQVSLGQRVAVVGPNGAGKSTLLKLVAGLLPLNQGRLEVYGHMPGEHICIGYVPQRTQVDWSFPASVEEVVMMGRAGRIGLFRWPRRRDWEIVRSSLERVRALHLARKQVGALSGGQQQRVFIARALAQEAELMLLDEPLAGLDLPSLEAIYSILDGLAVDGITIMLATHDLSLAAERFDRVLLLNRRMIGYGEPAVVLSQENLMRAYSGHLHIIADEQGTMVLADSCCDHDVGATGGRSVDLVSGPGPGTTSGGERP